MSDFSKVSNAFEVGDSIKYMLKYISKNDEKVVYSRGGDKTYIVSDVLDSDIFILIMQSVWQLIGLQKKRGKKLRFTFYGIHMRRG